MHSGHTDRHHLSLAAVTLIIILSFIYQSSWLIFHSLSDFECRFIITKFEFGLITEKEEKKKLFLSFFSIISNNQSNQAIFFSSADTTATATGAVATASYA